GCDRSRYGELGERHAWVQNVPLCVNYGYGGHIDDFFHGRAALQHMDRLRESHQDRPERFRTADAQHQLVGDVAGFEAWEDKDIGPLAERREGVLRQEFGDHRRIRHHLTVHHKLGIPLLDEFGCAADLFGQGMARAAEVRKGEHGHARLHAEAFGHFRRKLGDLRQILGGGLNVDGGVGKEKHVSLGYDNVEAGDFVDVGTSGDDLKRGPDGVGVMLGDARHEAVRIAHVDHHGAKVVVVGHQLARLAARDAAALAKPVEFLGVGVEPGRAIRFDDVKAQLPELQLAQLILDDHRPSQQHRMRDFQVGELVAGPDDLLVLAFGKDDALGRSLRPVTYVTHDFLGAPQPARELITVLFDVNFHLRHSTLHGRLGYRRGL